jgi:acyl-coenzyme A synthetase/AMP-(fatty) acid ligase/acyl carrier protein
MSFDLTLTSLFVPLVSGGRIIVYEEEEMGVLLGKIVTDSRLNGIKLTPSHLQVIRELGLSPAAGIRKWIVGGEDLETGLVRTIAGRCGEGVQMYNEYGPTEATVGCMIYTYTGGEKTASVPIGRPIRNTRIYILDGYGQRVPVGVEGELYVAGEGLAVGYLRQEDLTAERFIAAPWDGGLRLYRTGDLAVLDADGNILFRGRKDHQVKLRGYRIELGDIGHQLSVHPEVQEAVVVLRKIGGEPALVAYYVGAATEESLRAWLQTRLPAYMQPSYYCAVQELPVTANGKRDLRNLPAVQRGTAQASKAPANEMEERLVAIWSELLELEKEKIGVHKSFFELGGHSLKAISMVNRIFMEWDVEIPLEEIFNRETIADISQYIANELWIKGAVRSEAIAQDEYILD